MNGFQKMLYWSREKMESHALQYSSGYKAKKGYTFWEKDFDSMAKKTMLRQLISKWGVMSTELETAFVNDDAVVHNDGNGYFEPEPQIQPSHAEPPIEADFVEVEQNSADFEQVSIDEI